MIYLKKNRHLYKTLGAVCYCVLFFFISLIPANCLANSAVSNTETLKHGKRIFQENCISCHGIKGDGNGSAAKVILPKPRNFIRDPFKYGGEIEEIFKTITAGINGTAMPSWKSLSERDRRAVAAYVKHLSETAQPIKTKIR